jgi:hypothetical protein
MYMLMPVIINLLGAVILQDGKPIAYYTKDMNKAQSKYSTGEKEPLLIVETLKEFQNILLEQTVVVHTDHLNLLYTSMRQLLARKISASN